MSESGKTHLHQQLTVPRGLY